MFIYLLDIFKTHGKKTNKSKENYSTDEMIKDGDFLSNFLSACQPNLSSTQLLHLQAKKITSSE